MYAMHVLYSITIRPNLELKSRPEQLFGCHPIKYRTSQMGTIN